VLEALAADNQRRIDEQRRPQFSALKTENGQVQISLETDQQADSAAVQAAFCAATQLPFEEGRFRSRSAVAAAKESTGDDSASALAAVKEARRATVRALRHKLASLELGTFEKSIVRMLHGQHFRELKVARRSREGALLTARRKEGSLELRYAIRMLKGTASIDRKTVQDLRKDANAHNAHVALLVSPGDVRGDARQEALNGSLVFLWCGDGLADKFCESHTGVRVVHVELYHIDEAFFVQAKVDGDDAQRRREERHREKEKEKEATDPFGDSTKSSVVEGEQPDNAKQKESLSGERSEGEEPEGSGGPTEAAGGAGDGRRKRKRRRRRRGANRGEPGAQAAPEAGAPSDGASTESVAEEQAAAEATDNGEAQEASEGDA
jgi:ribonuclease E